MPRISSIEVLENRIAPAVFLVSGNSLTVRTLAGENAQDTDIETDARDLAESTAAVLLSKGDLLVLDLDNDNKVSEGDPVLVKVTGGKAMVFLTDVAGAGEGGFGADEITGLAVSTGFKGEIKTDVRGSVVTALDSTGALTASVGSLTVQPTSISGLKVTGHINGWLLAGESINNVNISAPLYGNAEQYSVDTIATGTKTNAVSVSFNGGATTFGTTFAFGSNKNGGSISNVVLANGTALITAGDGAESATSAAAGNGGSISKVTVVNSPYSVSVVAGNGGAASGSGKSGSGGSLSKIQIQEDGANTNVSFLAGHAGSTASGKAGTGGNITDLKVTITDTVQSVTVNAGEGEGLGRGGSVSRLKLTTATITGNLTINAGDGGTGVGRSNGAIGGSLTNSSIVTQAVIGRVSIYAGDGGSGGTDSGSGAKGGSVEKLQLQLIENSGEVTIGGGSGGPATHAPGAGGAGGKIAKVTIDTTGLTSATISAGSGGSGKAKAGGTGGSLQDISFENSGAVAGQLAFYGGAGGSVSDGKATAGTGGAVNKLEIHNEGGLGSAFVASGGGGTFTYEGAKGGRSGQVSGITINSKAEISSQVTISSASAGGPWAAPDFSGSGETSGDIRNITINDSFGATGIFSIYAGIGKAGSGEKGKGSSMGSISGVKLNAPDSIVKIGAVNIGGSRASDGPTAGGDGGNISKISGRVGILEIVAPDGGAGEKGGRGGSISDVNIAEVGDYVHLIAAGNGGDGTARAGAGGSVKNIKIAGEIGNFDASFGLTTYSALSPTMGGLVAGMKGGGDGATNGSIQNVSAERISAILAGRPAANAITLDHAVERIAKIRASVIGADTDDDGTFDFTEVGGGEGYQYASGDIAVDGLVIVNAGRYVLPVEPLKLIIRGNAML